jgi:DNA segregation ATPase FtsK/SpoIIIE, S-DNA-T family
MKFHCTLVRSPAAGPPDEPLELTIEAPEGTPGADIQRQLTRQFAAGGV